MAETLVSAAGSAPTISTKLRRARSPRVVRRTIRHRCRAAPRRPAPSPTACTPTATVRTRLRDCSRTRQRSLWEAGAAVPNSAGVTFPTPGTYYWHAAYSGDSNNAAATSACERLIVSNAQQANGRGGRGRFICHRIRKHGRHHHHGRFVLVCFRVTPPRFAQHGDGDNDHTGKGSGFAGSSTFISGPVASARLRRQRHRRRPLPPRRRRQLTGVPQRRCRGGPPGAGSQGR